MGSDWCGPVAEFRSDAARYTEDQGFDEVVSRLLGHSAAFARLWEQQEIEKTVSEKVVQHPTAGRLIFQSTVQNDDYPDLRVVILLPTQGTGSRGRAHALVPSRTG